MKILKLINAVNVEAVVAVFVKIVTRKSLSVTFVIMFALGHMISHYTYDRNMEYKENNSLKNNFT